VRLKRKKSLSSSSSHCKKVKLISSVRRLLKLRLLNVDDPSYSTSQDTSEKEDELLETSL
jgi:hypothetical protein